MPRKMSSAGGQERLVQKRATKPAYVVPSEDLTAYGVLRIPSRISSGIPSGGIPSRI